MKKIIIGILCLAFFASCAPTHQAQPPVPPGAPAPPPPPPAP